LSEPELTEEEEMQVTTEEEEESTEEEEESTEEEEESTEEEEELTAEEECSCLQQNDPSLFEIYIVDLSNNKARRYGEALQQNTVVEELNLRGRNLSLDNGDLDLLFEFIERSQSLTRVYLGSIWDVRVIRRFLFALSRSSSVEDIKLHESAAVPAESLQRLLCCMRSLIKLTMFRIRIIMEGSMAQPSVEFSQDKSIEDLNLQTVEESCAIQVLHFFGSQSNIKRLSIRLCNTEMSASFSKCLEQFLTASASLQTINLESCNFVASTFEPISAGLKHCQNLQKMVLSSCDFDSESADLLVRVFKQNCSLEEVSNSFHLQKADNGKLATMQLCCARNKSIREWIVVHNTVPTSYWPKVFESALAYKYRHDVIFRGLMALGDRVGQERSSKRSLRRSSRLRLKSQTRR
jgi:hypothetical protein